MPFDSTEFPQVEVSVKERAAAILRGALALLADRRNWLQGVYADERGGHCLSGAVAQAGAVRPSVSDSLAMWTARRALMRCVPVGDIIRFNDAQPHDEAGHAAVLAVLRAALEDVSRGGG